MPSVLRLQQVAPPGREAAQRAWARRAGRLGQDEIPPAVQAALLASWDAPVPEAQQREPVGQRVLPSVERGDSPGAREQDRGETVPEAQQWEPVVQRVLPSVERGDSPGAREQGRGETVQLLHSEGRGGVGVAEPQDEQAAVEQAASRSEQAQDARSGALERRRKRPRQFRETNSLPVVQIGWWCA